jgi:hypothetical protein
VLIGLVTIGILSSSSSSKSDNGSADVAASAAPDAGTDAQAEAGGSGAGGAEQPATGDDAVPPSDEETNEGGASESAGDDGAIAPASPSTTDLGAVGNADELADRVRALGSTPLGAMEGGETSSDTDDEANHSAVDGEGSSGRGDCEGLTEAGDRSRGQVVYVADAVLAGNPVRVHVYDPGDGELRMVATDRSCSDVVDVPFTR